MNINQTTKKLQNFIKQNKDLNTTTEHDIASIYQDFIDCLTDHNHLYYINNAPIISDIEYDELFNYLKKIEEYFPHIISGNSPTQGLTGQFKTQEGFNKADHQIPLLSLENSYNAKDLIDREKRTIRILEKKKHGKDFIKNLSYYIEPKFDGISVELIYKNGELHQAITRGDGITGEDITANTKTIKNIQKINFKGEIHIRGEIMMPKSQLLKLNKQREVDGENPFANTRNAAAGSIKLLDINIVAKRGLVCYVYDILTLPWIETRISPTKTHTEFKDILIKELGLPIFQLKNIPTKIKSIKKIIDICENTENKKYLDSQDLEFDGLVIKVSDKYSRIMIGETNHHPRRAIAYKFPAEQISTQINSVDFQVGRTGIITPVANLEPVQLSGVKISRVSLHNFDFISHKDIKIHDFVRLQRSGEVIPYITSVIKDRRDTNIIKNIEAPKLCPSCGTQITKIDMHYYCTNTSCPAQIKEKLIHFASKNCMNIEGIGDSIVNILVDQNIVKNFADLYSITDGNIRLKIQGIPGFGSKKLFEITEQLEKSKHKPLRRLLNALGIPGVGKKTAQEIVKALTEENINNYKVLKQKLSDKEFLENIYGIGEKIIDGVINYFDINNNILKKLEVLGLNFSANKYNQQNNINTEHSGKHFAITGSFPVTRDQIIEEFESQGAIFDSQPNKKTDFMLIGGKAGSKKAKAEELGVTIYEGRKNITKSFGILNQIHINNNNNNKNTGPIAQSLF